MFDPVVMPLPTALAVVAALAVGAVAYRRWVENGVLTFETALKQLHKPVQTPAVTGGRHRLGAASTPYQARPWASPERASVFPMPSASWPTEVERARFLTEISAGSR